MRSQGSVQVTEDATSRSVDRTPHRRRAVVRPATIPRRHPRSRSPSPSTPRPAMSEASAATEAASTTIASGRRTPIRRSRGADRRCAKRSLPTPRAGCPSRHGPRHRGSSWWWRQLGRSLRKSAPGILVGDGCLSDRRGRLRRRADRCPAFDRTQGGPREDRDGGEDRGRDEPSDDPATRPLRKRSRFWERRAATDLLGQIGRLEKIERGEATVELRHRVVPPRRGAPGDASVRGSCARGRWRVRSRGSRRSRRSRTPRSAGAPPRPVGSAGADGGGAAVGSPPRGSSYVVSGRSTSVPASAVLQLARGDTERRPPDPRTRVTDLVASSNALRERLGHGIVGHLPVVGECEDRTPQPRAVARVQLGDVRCDLRRGFRIPHPDRSRSTRERVPRRRSAPDDRPGQAKVPSASAGGS